MNVPTISLPKIGSPVLTARISSFAAPVGAIIVSIVVLAFVTWPKFSQVLKLRTENEQLATRATNLEAKAQKLATYDIQVLNKQLIGAVQLMPSDKNIFSIVSQIERAASSAGVLLNNLEVVAPGQANAQAAASPQPAPAPATSISGEVGSKVQIRVSTTSDYKSFLQFLSNTLVISRVVSIPDLGISSSAQSGSASQLKTALTIDASYLPLPKELSSIEAPIEDLTDSEISRLEGVSNADLGSTVVPQVPLGRNDLFASF